jgi:D-glycero-alpha-D-manno-heptose-7-phosphate kinase
LPPFFVPIRHRIVWSKIELAEKVAEIIHPAVRGGLEMMKFSDENGLEIHHQGDLPARSGMGSSSSFAVGLLNALYGLSERMIDKMALAEEAIHLEQNVLKENVGCQDQIAAAFGGFNLIHFGKDGKFLVEPVILPKARLEELNNNLLLIFTGTSRIASEVAKDVVANISQNQERLRKMHQLVDDAMKILTGSGSLDAFGELLHETWTHKRKLSELVSNSEIDMIYNLARENGAIGGKLLGAGSSGFMLFYVPQKDRAQLEKALSEYLIVPFSFENQGSTIIYYQPNY